MNPFKIDESTSEKVSMVIPRCVLYLPDFAGLVLRLPP